MTDQVATVIMADRRREHFIRPLRDTLGEDAPVVYDDGTRSRWLTGRRSMLAAATMGRQRCLVLQDDAVAAPDLLAAVERACARVPANAVMCLYLGNTKRFWNAIAAMGYHLPDDTAWIVMPQAHWGVALVIPTGYVAEIVRFGDRYDDPATVGTRRELNYDRRVSRWCESVGVPVYYPWPSYVSHREHTPSLVAGRQSWGRYAKRFIGDEHGSALAHDIDGRTVQIPKLHVAPATGHIHPPRPHQRA